jgi:excisionase family DNA binding protein
VPEIERCRKLPLVVEMLLWDGSNHGQIDEFAGDDNVSRERGCLDVWNDQERAWIAVPLGHYVAKSTLGELYPVSPEAREATFEPAERLLTSGEVAVMFRVAPKTVTRWAAQERIASIRTSGGRRRYRESEVRALLRGEGDGSPP